MAEQISTLTPFRVLDANGDPISGAKAYFYETGTTNLETVYTTNALSSAHPSPLVADSQGAFPPVWHSGTPALKVVVHDASDVEINGSPLDPAPMTSSATTAANIAYTPTVNNPASNVQEAIDNASSSGREVETKGASYTILSADRNKLIRATTDITLTFPASTVLGNGWNTMVEGAGGAITITADGSETTQIATVADGESAFIFTDGSNLLGAKFPALGTGFAPSSYWQDVTGSRTHNTSYQNTTGYDLAVHIRGEAAVFRPIQVSTDDFATDTVSLGGIRGDGDNMSIFAIVPNGQYYKLNGGLTSMDIWAERRA